MLLENDKKKVTIERCMKHRRKEKGGGGEVSRKQIKFENNPQRKI